MQESGDCTSLTKPDEHIVPKILGKSLEGLQEGELQESGDCTLLTTPEEHAVPKILGKSLENPWKDFRKVSCRNPMIAPH